MGEVFGFLREAYQKTINLIRKHGINAGFFTIEFFVSLGEDDIIASWVGDLFDSADDCRKEEVNHLRNDYSYGEGSAFT